MISYRPCLGVDLSIPHTFLFLFLISLGFSIQQSVPLKWVYVHKDGCCVSSHCIKIKAKYLRDNNFAILLKKFKARPSPSGFWVASSCSH